MGVVIENVNKGDKSRDGFQIESSKLMAGQTCYGSCFGCYQIGKGTES